MKVTNETKQILGYNCKKTIMDSIIAGKKIKQIEYIYETAETQYCIKPFSIFLGVNGLEMGKETQFDSDIQVWTAQSITIVSIDSSIFDIPSYYNIMTTEEYMKVKVAEITRKMEHEKDSLNREFANEEIQRKIDEQKMYNNFRQASLKETWNDIKEKIIPAIQEGVAYGIMKKNPNAQSTNNLIQVTSNNLTLSPENAIKENNKVLSKGNDMANKSVQEPNNQPQVLSMSNNFQYKNAPATSNTSSKNSQPIPSLKNNTPDLYTGIYFDLVKKLLYRVYGGNYTVSPTVKICCSQRDAYVAEAIMYAWAAVMHTSEGKDTDATNDAKAMKQDLDKSNALCSSSPVSAGNFDPCCISDFWSCADAF